MVVQAKRQKIYKSFEKYLFKFINNAVFGKTVKNVRKQRNIKLATTKRRRRYYLVSEPSYHTTKFFTEHLLAIEIKKLEILKPVNMCIWDFQY